MTQPPLAYERWRRHFLENRESPFGVPWLDPCRLSAGERRLVGRSIQQFHLGEWGRGRGLLRRAASLPLAADPSFLPSLELFVLEEQVHSNLLGRFLDLEGIPRLRRHWLAAFFRRLRKLAGLELCVMVLVTAEVLAIPFYEALRDATGSRVLRAICWRILYDETAHLEYQALTLGLLRRPRSAPALRLRAFLHACLFRATALLVWQQHRPVFRAAGWDLHRFREACGREFSRLEFRIRQASLGRVRPDPALAFRLAD